MFLPTMRLVQILDPQFEQPTTTRLHHRAPGQDGRRARHRASRASKNNPGSGLLLANYAQLLLIQDKKANLPELLKLAEQAIQPDGPLGQRRTTGSRATASFERYSILQGTNRWSMRSQKAQDALKQQGAGSARATPNGLPAGERELAMLTPDYYYTKRARHRPRRRCAATASTTLLIDLDNTLLPRDSDVIPDEHRKRGPADLAATGFRACLVSNNWHERVSRVAEELGLRPRRQGGQAAAVRVPARRCGCWAPRRAQTAVIGDQLFTDVLGGKLIGHARRCSCDPLSPADLPHTLLLAANRARAAGRGRTHLP